MDSGYHLREDNPKTNSSWLSKLLYMWIVKLVYKCGKKGLQVADLYRTLKEDRSDILADRLNVNWDLELQRAMKKKERPRLLRAISNTFLLEYMVWGMLQFIELGVTRTFIPVALAQLIKQFSDKSDGGNIREMSIYSGILTGLAVLQVFTRHHCNFGLSRTGMRIRVAVSSLIYRKITRLNQHSFAQTASGQVINLLSNDVIRFDFAVLYLHSLWIMPITVAISTYFLWSQVGISCLAGILSMLMFSVPVQGYFAKLTGQLRHKIANKTDARVKLMNEIVSGIQVIKMYAWEKPFEHIVKLARKSEVSDLTKTSYLRGIYCGTMVYLERLALFLVLMSYTLLGHTITADKVFSLAQFYNTVQLVLAINFPMAITYGSESLVSINRLENFLQLEEKEIPNLERLSKTGIIMSKVSASWSQKTFTLKDISIEIPSGTLCAIVGPVGAGKSSILQLIMGELPVSSGKLSIGGEIAYSSQNPWLFAGTIRNNILFGQPYSQSKYDKTVEVCCLTKDFEQLPSGDKTVVGERGVSLSGGQRARINLARAIYRAADIYLLDDPLSAVDAHVGKQMFDECIYKHLKSKTRILVTHQLQYLKRANLIIIVNDGKIEAQGSFEELSKLNMNFSKILLSADGGSDFPELADHMDDQVHLAFDRRRSTISSTNSSHSDALDAVVDDFKMDEEASDRSARPLSDYFKSTKKPCSIVTLIIMLVVAQAACSGADYFSAFWSQQEEIKHANNTPVKDETYRLQPIEMYDSNKHNSYYTYITSIPEERFNLSIFDNLFENIQDGDRTYNVLTTESSLYIYGSVIILAIVLTLGRSILFFALCMVASKNLHSVMFHSLLSARMRFFDTNPCGRILNRFSKDMGAIDEILPRVLLEATQVMLVLLGILVNISLVNPYMIIAIIILGALFNHLRKIYMSTAKDIKHLEGIAKSPVFSHVSATLNGLTTIRAAKIEDLLTEQFDHHQDIHTSSWYLSLSCTAAFGLWLDLFCVIFVGCVILSFILLKQYMFEVNGALVGLAISQSLILTGMVQIGMYQTAEVVNQLTSVERVLQYTKIDTEKSFETPNDKKRDEPWPSEGKIEFIGMSLKYIEDEPAVLKNLTLTIYPGEKIGIVGRTGAGKSSLIAALFRLAPLDGCITIDGVDTKDIDLHDLRKKISIIPQEPVLFSASMRYNLDPFGEYEDSELWNALDEVEMKTSITSLDYMVHEGGANFSLGQRQLICLARAILRNNKILVMDEATANVDPQTDAFIQETIRKKFKDCTVLTIAHRLNTIMDSDKVLVMNFGSMVEFDHPHKLLQIPEGYFYSMVQETGPSMSRKLKEIAMETHKKIIQ